MRPRAKGYRPVQKRLQRKRPTPTKCFAQAKATLGETLPTIPFVHPFLSSGVFSNQFSCHYVFIFQKIHRMPSVFDQKRFFLDPLRFSTPPKPCHPFSTSPELRGPTPLHLAAIRGHVEVSELLIGSGASLNLKDSDGLGAPERGGGSTRVSG